MKTVLTGLDNLEQSPDLQRKIQGNIGYLCHSASVNRHLESGVVILKKLFGKRLKKLFAPQHGFDTTVQANMIESQDFFHPYFQIPVHSLYSSTRIPTAEMLQGIDTILVDLQDVGTRVYTYFSTVSLLMETCAEKEITLVILDRPNPIGGKIIEGNVLQDNFKSFVGRFPLPMRHGMTLGELAIFVKTFHGIDCYLKIISMKNWKRSQFFQKTRLPWVLPSPNLPTVDSTLTFVGTVLFEGTNISEGRGTTRSLEIIGHPKIEPFEFKSYLKDILKKLPLKGFILRPMTFIPTFDKHRGQICGGFQIHVTNPRIFRPWTLAQILCRELYQVLEKDFVWNTAPYEYEFDTLAIDLINGNTELRQWVEKNGSFEELQSIEQQGREEFESKRQQVLIYK